MDTDVVVQLNFNTGAGDLYCAFSQLLTFSANCKSAGMTVGFIYNFNNNQYFHDSDSVKLDRFFNIQQFDSIFSYITKTQAKETVAGYSYLFTPYLYIGDKLGGRHWWDAFINNNSGHSTASVMDQIMIFCMRELPSATLSYTVPTISDNILRFSGGSCDRVGLHIRTMDQSDSLKLIEGKIDAISDIFKNPFVYVCSNSTAVRKHLKQVYGAMVHSPRHPNISYQYGTFKWDKNVTETQLLENFEDTLVDMYNLSMCSKLYSASEWGRPTNFLFYAKSHNRNLEIITL
jgi:hypothetical protein